MLEQSELVRLDDMSREELVETILHLDRIADKYYNRLRRYENGDLRQNELGGFQQAELQKLCQENQWLKQEAAHLTRIRRGLPGADRKPKATANVLSKETQDDIIERTEQDLS